ncbi:MAG TPA: hypothetical protein VFD70_05375 [Anaerolineae bacterium]|nr:hypothetical protein [Anaerolineae bacterium]
MQVEIESQLAQSKPYLQLHDASMHLTTLALSEEAWYTWQPTGINGIEYRWLGNTGTRLVR